MSRLPNASARWTTDGPGLTLALAQIDQFFSAWTLSGHFFSVHELRYIGPLTYITEAIESFCFRADDRLIALQCADGSAWILPLAQISAYVGRTKTAAAIDRADHGVGAITPYEVQHDVLLAEAPHDLAAAARERWQQAVKVCT